MQDAWRMSLMMVVVLVLGVTGGVRSEVKEEAGPRIPAGTCRCVPPQWEGLLSTVEREFDLTDGQAGSRETYLYVSYDFHRGLFSMSDLKTGYRAIADYTKGYKYVTRGDRECRQHETNEQMKQMCLPDFAEYMGEFSLANPDILVDRWQFHGPYNVSMKTTVVQKNCMPVTEEVYMRKGGFVSITSSMYLDVTFGIRDPGVFVPPSNCLRMFYPGRHGPNNEPSKRGGAWTLLNMLKPGKSD